MPQLAKFTAKRSEYIYLPDSEDFLLGSIKWGSPSELFSPAYWKLVSWHFGSRYEGKTLGFGKTLVEEVIACVLGGYGIRADIAFAAYQRLKYLGLISETRSSYKKILNALSVPLKINGRKYTYRFSKQKSRYISQILANHYSMIQNLEKVNDGVELRTRLTELPGVGLKTSSWITRNWLKSNQVAIIDIHLYRAGVITGFFQESQSINKDYLEMEQSFLNFSSALGVKASTLDFVIWENMRTAGKIATDLVARS